MQNKRFALIARAVVVCLSTCAGLLCLEVLLRIQSSRAKTIGLDKLEQYRHRLKGGEGTLGDMVMASTDKRLVFELIPGLDMYFGGYRVQTNKDGFRDDDIETQKRKGEFLIAVLGDSGTFGWRVSREDCY